MKRSKRNPYVEILRFLFCLLIVNYHFFSHFLINVDFPNYFTRSYLGDEYFFIIAGFYLSKAASKVEKNHLSWGVKQTIGRIKKIAIPYYLTWIVCFVGVRYTQVYFGETSKSILSDAGNSIFELLFLEMFGFKKGLYSNDVAWFFSALLIVTFIIAPWIAKHKRRFSYYCAPLIVFFSYGILSLNYDWLYAPYYLIGNSNIMKGTIRALAAVCVGVMLEGLLQSEAYLSIKDKMKIGTKRIICFIDIILWLVIVVYMIFPFAARNYETEVQYDYIITLLMMISLIPILGELFPEPRLTKLYTIANGLGKYAFFAYFGQAVFYSFDKIIYSLDISILFKGIILNLAVPFFSLLLFLISEAIKKHIRGNKGKEK